MQTTLTLTWGITQAVFWWDLMAATITVAAVPLVIPPYLLYRFVVERIGPVPAYQATRRPMRPRWNRRS